MWKIDEYNQFFSFGTLIFWFWNTLGLNGWPNKKYNKLNKIKNSFWNWIIFGDFIHIKRTFKFITLFTELKLIKHIICSNLLMIFQFWHTYSTFFSLTLHFYNLYKSNHFKAVSMCNKSLLNCLYWWLSIADELLIISIFVKSNFP